MDEIKDVSDFARAQGHERVREEAKKAKQNLVAFNQPGEISEDRAENLSWLQPKPISELSTTQPDQILRGILYRGCKGTLMGGSKSYKTWTLMEMAYCVANGLLWWGVTPCQAPVVYLDFELLEYDFRWRMEQIAKAHGKGTIDAVKRIGLRGKPFVSAHWSNVHGFVKGEGAGLVIADPIYKLLGPYRDENSATDIAQVTGIFDRLTEATGASAFYAQHYSKGNQAAKESIDRGAGSGVWARDADAIITMTKHAAGDDCLSIETTLRSFPKMDPFVVRWQFPLFTREPSLDPADLKLPKVGGSVPKFSVDDLVECIGARDLSAGEFQKRAEKETGMRGATFYKLLKIGARKESFSKAWMRNGKPSKTRPKNEME